MCEFTRTVKTTNSEGCGNTEKVSGFKLVTAFILRIVSLFMVYFLLSNNFNFINFAVCAVLIATELHEILSEK